MSCQNDDCVITFAAYCHACRWDGPERDAVPATVADCVEHNCAQRHIQGHKGYAHVRVVHHHEFATQGARA